MMILEVHGTRVKFVADYSKMYAQIIDGFDVVNSIRHPYAMG